MYTHRVFSKSNNESFESKNGYDIIITVNPNISFKRFVVPELKLAIVSIKL